MNTVVPYRYQVRQPIRRKGSEKILRIARRFAEDNCINYMAYADDGDGPYYLSQDEIDPVPQSYAYVVNQDVYVRPLNTFGKVYQAFTDWETEEKMYYVGVHGCLYEVREIELQTAIAPADYIDRLRQKLKDLARRCPDCQGQRVTRPPTLTREIPCWTCKPLYDLIDQPYMGQQ